jgi:hypothetical protein
VLAHFHNSFIISRFAAYFHEILFIQKVLLAKYPIFPKITAKQKVKNETDEWESAKNNKPRYGLDGISIFEENVESNYHQEKGQNKARIKNQPAINAI